MDNNFNNQQNSNQPPQNNNPNSKPPQNGNNKKRKIIIIALVILGLIFAFNNCGNKGGKTKPNGPSNNTGYYTYYYDEYDTKRNSYSVECPACDNGYVTCSSCNGEGVLHQTGYAPNYGYGSSSTYDIEVKCGQCNGKGSVQCYRCGGDGWLN